MKIQGSIKLKDLHFYAHHGWYEEERKIGGRYLLDIEVHLILDGKLNGIQIDHTVNYEEIYSIAETQMNISRKLLEDIVMSIGNEIRNRFDVINSVNVCLKKLDVPMGKHSGTAEVEMVF